jgi:hypothetical protein
MVPSGAKLKLSISSKTPVPEAPKCSGKILVSSRLIMLEVDRRDEELGSRKMVRRIVWLD